MHQAVRIQDEIFKTDYSYSLSKGERKENKILGKHRKINRHDSNHYFTARKEGRRDLFIKGTSYCIFSKMVFKDVS